MLMVKIYDRYVVFRFGGMVFIMRYFGFQLVEQIIWCYLQGWSVDWFVSCSYVRNKDGVG